MKFKKKSKTKIIPKYFYFIDKKSFNLIEVMLIKKINDQQFF